MSNDAKLPALPDIAQSLSPAVPNQSQPVITAFAFGMGFGTRFAGPLSDRYGRKITVQEMFRHQGTVAPILVQSLTLRRLFSTLSSIQGNFDQQFHRADGFAVVTLLLINFGLLPLDWAFAVFLLWTIGLFAMMGTALGNLNALELEPLGPIAGLVASVKSSIATVVPAIPVGQMFNGTSLPLMIGVTVFAGLALLLEQFGLAEGRV